MGILVRIFYEKGYDFMKGIIKIEIDGEVFFEKDELLIRINGNTTNIDIITPQKEGITYERISC